MKVNFPGRGTETVALARIKPAFVSDELDDNEEPQDDDEAPSPPPSPPRNLPPPTHRQQPPPPQQRRRQNTRRGARHIADYNRPQPPAPAQLAQEYDPGEGTSAQARANSSPIPTDEEDNYLNQLRRPRNITDNRQDSDLASTPDPYDGHTPSDPNLAPCQCDNPDDRAAPCNNDPPQTPPAPSNDDMTSRPVAARPGPSSDSGPVPPSQAVSPHPRPVTSSDLSRRRARPNYGPSLSAILKSHLLI